jgi:hypothetical protein
MDFLEMDFPINGIQAILNDMKGNLVKINWNNMIN